MSEEIRQRINSSIYNISSIKRDYESQATNAKVLSKLFLRGPIFSSLRQASNSEIEKNQPMQVLSSRFSLEIHQVNHFLGLISIKTSAKKYEPGQKYAGILQSEILASSNLKQKIKETLNFLKKLSKKDAIYTKDLELANAPKLARKTSISENIKLAKASIDKPDAAISYIRTAIGLIIQEKFGFDVKSIPKFVKICNENGVQLPRLLEVVYDIASKSGHRGLAPSTSDVRSALAFIESFEEEIRKLELPKEKLDELRSQCEKERIIFKNKS